MLRRCYFKDLSIRDVEITIFILISTCKTFVYIMEFKAMLA